VQIVASIKGGQHRHHWDYEDDDSDSMNDSVDNLYDYIMFYSIFFRVILLFVSYETCLD
jgi:hypothetical protein